MPLDWTVECPLCTAKFDSGDNYGDSRAMLRAHFENVHNTKDY